VVTHQLQVERRTGKVCQSETDVLPLCHATNLCPVDVGIMGLTEIIVLPSGLITNFNSRPLVSNFK